MIQLRDQHPSTDRPRTGREPHLAVLRDPLPDLELRLYSPRPEVVVVRVSGAVDERGARLLGERVGQQLAHAMHVVVDLAEVPALRHCGTRVLADLDREATRCGGCLHITGVEDGAVCDQLRAADLEPAPCTDTVVALLPPRMPRRRRRR